MTLEEFANTELEKKILQNKPAATVKDVADKYPGPPKEKIVETTCPCCQKTAKTQNKGVNMDIVEKTVIAISAVTFILLMASGAFLTKAKCKAKAEKMGFECDWGFVQGCMINVNGKWMSMEYYRVIE